jgi:superfamily II DNA or RNA helicase
MSYDQFIAAKFRAHEPSGFDVDRIDVPLFEFQRDIVRWALRRGRCAVFADTGLGKTRMQLAWAQRIPGSVLILAPLAVAQQTAAEGASIGINVNVCREQSDVIDGINITNYDRVHKFDPSAFSGVVLDESSIIKNFTGKTLNQLLDMFGRTQYKLCATATPSPNDYTELGTHAEFLGVCSRVEMLSEFFVHDGGETQTWRLKGHARRDFWRWVSSWACAVRRPSDLGYSDAGYELEPYDQRFHIFQLDKESAWAAGQLFATEAAALLDRRTARQASIKQRVKACCDLVNGEPHERWVVWCEYNDESDALAAGIPGSVEIRGSQTIEEKERELIDFADGRTRVLISKASMTGFGLNWQHVARMAFVGVSDSFEQYYQAVRRCWRFGQKRKVHVHLFASETEGAVVRNMERKAGQAEQMSNELREFVAESVLRGGQMNRTTNEYKPTARIAVPKWMGG